MKSPRDLLLMLLLTLLSAGAAFILDKRDPGLRGGSGAEMSLHAEEPVLPEAREEAEPERYGIRLGPYREVGGKVKRNQNLASLLVDHGISPKQVYEISLLPDSLLDERKIRPGQSYTLMIRADSVADYFVYEKDERSYVVVGFSADSVWARNGQKPVRQLIRTASGTIESSLWEAMRASDTNPVLAIELSEIFAWSIDFFGIQAGDRYKVLYEETYVDSVPVGINRILGAWFWHNNTDFWGIPFEQDGRISFFDEEGNSLRKAFLKAPLRFSRISSGFSHSRYHPVLKIRRPHHGVDYAAPAGTPVLTVGDGIITKMGYQRNGGGNYVQIKHNSVYSTTYMHLSRFGKGVQSGKYVKQGDVIGYVGSTGLATGPHLDFRFYRNGSPVNPLKVEAPPVEPVHEANMAAYDRKRAMTMSILKLIR